jgi:MoxR-like ATPase
VADALAAAHAASEALAAAVAEREAAQAAQAATPPAHVVPEGLTHYAFADMLEDLRAGNFPYLVGPAGSGKTTAARQSAKALGVAYTFISCTPDMGQHQFFGFITAGTGEYRKGCMRDAWEFGGLVLVDEMDKGSAEAVAALNGMLALPVGAEFTFPDGENVPRHPMFFVVAAGNTAGHGADDTYVAAGQLDGSSLDRFTVSEWGYDETLERAMIPADLTWWAERVQTLRKAAQAAGARLLITPRATEQGARLLARGNMTQAKVEDRTVWRMCPEDTRRSVLAHA